MTFQPITPTAEQWDQFVEQHPRAHLLQLPAWGSLKSAFGWEPLRVAIADESGALVAGCQLLLRDLPLRLGRFAYAPYAPLVEWANTDQARALLAAIDTAAKAHRAAFLKIEPGLHVTDVNLESFGFIASPQTVQPPRTVVLDISGDDEAILARMNQKTRRNIRKSDKFEVSITHGTREALADFNVMIAETGDRGEFGVHTPEYYERAFDLFVPDGRAALIMGSYNGQPLAGVMVFALGDWSWYLYGASSSQERKRMASYGVQWAGIQWAKSRGAQYYDMYGVPDVAPDELEAQFQERSDGLWGVYRFKRGWGGDVLRSAGTWDRVYNRLIYNAYRVALRLHG